MGAKESHVGRTQYLYCGGGEDLTRRDTVAQDSHETNRVLYTSLSLASVVKPPSLQTFKWVEKEKSICSSSHFMLLASKVSQHIHLHDDSP